MSGNRVSLIGLSVCLLAAAPVETKTDNGVIDWSARVVRVVGVGTPKIVSTTGALTNTDLYEAARIDAERRLRRVLSGLPIGNGTTLGELPAVAPALHKAVLQLTAGETKHFADGTVHLPAKASFAWVPEEVGEGPKRARPIEKDATSPTGVILELGSQVTPTAQALLVSADGLTVGVGTSGDTVGAKGISWVHSKADALASPLAGARPLFFPAAIGSSGPGQIFRLSVDAAQLFEASGVPGGLVVIMPAPTP